MPSHAKKLDSDNPFRQTATYSVTA